MVWGEAKIMLVGRGENGGGGERYGIRRGENGNRGKHMEWEEQSKIASCKK